MTDWDLITEQIQRAMQMVNQAHVAGEELVNETNAKNLIAFQKKMRRLQEGLSRMQWALENPGQYSMDEVISELNRIFSGKPSAYRTSTEVHAPMLGDEE